MGYLKRYAMPKFWKLARKEKTWVVKPRPGPHAKERCLPLQVILRDVLKYAENAKEAKKMVRSGLVFVDKKPRKEPGFPVGLMDALEIPESKKYFRVLLGAKGLFLEEIKPEETNKKLCRIERKTTISGGLVQLGLHDGRTIVIKDNTYKPGDSILISVPEQKILSHYKLQKGEEAFIIYGKNTGFSGKIADIKERKTMLEKSAVVIEDGGKKIETLKDYIMVGVRSNKNVEAIEEKTEKGKEAETAEMMTEKPKMAKTSKKVKK